MNLVPADLLAPGDEEALYWMVVCMLLLVVVVLLLLIVIMIIAVDINATAIVLLLCSLTNATVISRVLGHILGTIR
jgi:hypothetical protein